MMKKLIAILPLLLAASSARAQTSATGFTIERFEPTPAGEWSFWVDHPWYTRKKYFAAAGLTFDYANKPLVFGTVDASGFRQTQSVIEHQLAMHVDVAGSFLDRVTISASLPVVLLERGAASNGVAPLGGGAVGDPRVGAMVRLFGQPLGSAISVHLGAFLWIPVSANGNHAGDSTVRFMPKLALGGFTHRLLWSFTAAFEYRKDASIGTLAAGAGNTVGSEMQFGAAIAYADFRRRFAVGPEAIVSTVVSAGGGNVFARDYTSFELLAGAHYNVGKLIQLGLAGGIGASRAPGTPDGRVIFRVAYAPLRTPDAERPADRDGDGIVDAEDSCPDERGLRAADPAQNGCPVRDRDGDGVADARDLCPDEPAGVHADAARPGCPEKDSDGDGVFDSADQCPTVAAGPHPDAKRPGCADTDTDSDGVFDSADQCPSEPAGLHADPARPGCALPDRDADQIPDAQDACPDQPGAPDPDAKKNGCPGLVQIKGGMLVIMEPVFFATAKDVILPRSFPVLQAVANALAAQPEIKHVSVEGHTDAQGKPEKNLDLSTRRAASVLRWLVEHGVGEERLESHGFGQTRPVASNRTAAGRAANRRVEFRIVDAAKP
jgi:outer membrane protein OmpA-like peptidoglycan-associated protein